MSLEPCCCCSSRTGSLVIGILEIISNIFLIIVFALGVGDENDKGLKTAMYLEIVIAIFVLFIAILLLLGITKEKPRYVKIWIGVRSFFLVANIILLIAALCTGDAAAGTIATDLISIALSFWYLYVVYHFLKQLENVGNVGSIQDRYPPNQP